KESARIAALIKELGNDDFKKRETAGNKLAKIGKPALPALRDEALGNDDAEIRRRALRVARKIRPAFFTSKSSGMKLTLIRAGDSPMGSFKSEPGRRPDEQRHWVRVGKSFFLGTREVTQAQYKQVMKTNPSWFADTGLGKFKVAGTATGDFPVKSVTWFDALE